MKKRSLACGLLMLVSMQVLADASAELQRRLGNVNSFHAAFSQKVTDSNGANVQEGRGELWVQRPNKFNWHMTVPDESIIISDGSAVWFYNPFVEQVSVSWLREAAGDTPFMLIARNRPADWQKYTVQQQGDNFTLTPKTAAGNLRQFTLSVSSSGTISQFSAIEQDGQRSSYRLQSQQNGPISAAKFTFTPPAGVTVDDQRR